MMTQLIVNGRIARGMVLVEHYFCLGLLRGSTQTQSQRHIEAQGDAVDFDDTDEPRSRHPVRISRQGCQIPASLI